MSTCNSNIVVEWLRSLQLGQYADSFLDNGYDDLEICKQVGDPDLDAIGVFNPNHRQLLLQSVRSLREEGAASVYFTLEETAAATSQFCGSDNNSTRSSRPSSGRCSDKDIVIAGISNLANINNSPAGTTLALSSNVAAQINDSPISSSGSVTELGKYLDEYEEGKAELVRIPKLQLKLLLKEKLLHDGIRLSCQPYSTSTGERGYLEGLASRYADRFNTHYQDVLEHLEELRRREWEELSPRMRVLPSNVSTPGTPPFPGPQALLLTPVSSNSSGAVGLPVSISQQPIYAPGKYSLLPRVLTQPSSCLSDKEEDEIYGFGYGVYGKQMFQRQQQQRVVVQAAAAAAAAQHPSPSAVPIYQSCLSPRSAYFYEFPPSGGVSSGGGGGSGSEQGGCNAGTTKKKTTTFSRLLRGLKPHRKDKTNASSPTARQRSGCGGKSGAVTSPASRVGTPEGLCEGMVPTLMPSVADIRDYDRLRFLQMNGGAGGVATSFEETIQRLKMQEALKKKERFHKEQEEILRDIRHGLMQIGLEGGTSGGAMNPFPGASDDTYMYDDEVRVAGPPLPPLHWYDEPPYESDPEDFLMGGLQPTLGRPNAAVFQNGRVCFTLNLRSEPRGEGVISLRSAGDISLPRDGSWRGSGSASRSGHRHGSRHKHAANRESGDYAGSDVQSVGSRLSTVSVETSRSEHEAMAAAASPYNSPSVALIQPQGKGRTFRTLVSYKARSHASMSEDGLSPSHSSDYEEHEEMDRIQPDRPNAVTAAAIIHSRLETEPRSGAATLVGRMRGLRQDVQRKISRFRTNQNSSDQRTVEGERRSGPKLGHAANAALVAPNVQAHSSAESLPSGSGSSTQALVPAGSAHSLLSPEEVADKSSLLPVIGKARALVDYIPSPYDKEALRFKKGDVIEVLSMNASGLWRGRNNNRMGTFKFINVELLSEGRPGSAGTNSSRGSRSRYPSSRTRPSHKRGKPKTVEELLQRMNMETHISVFVLNGYEDLELFKELEEADLDFLGINHPEHRAKILTAVQLLHDYDSPDTPESEDEDEDDEPESSTDGSAGHSSEASRGHKSFHRLQFPRDSGCYASSSERPPRRSADSNNSPRHLSKHLEPLVQEPPNNLDSTTSRKIEETSLVTGSPIRSNCSSPASVSSKKKSASAAVASALAAASASAAQSRRQELEDYHPNIPVTENIIENPDPTPLNVIHATPSSPAPRTPTFDFRAEYDKLRGKLEASLNRGSPIRTRKATECGGESIALRQLTSEMASARCFSEKSSDSGISSSSRSPPPPQNSNPSAAAAAAVVAAQVTPQTAVIAAAAQTSTATNSPTRAFAAFGCGLDRKPGTPNLLSNTEKSMFQ